jgi:hypothetical protein
MIKYNDRLGFLPFSNFIDWSKTKKELFAEIDILYRDIRLSSCNDIIFTNVMECFSMIEWLIPRLISEQYFVSIITNLYDFEKFVASRVIVETNISERNYFSKLNSLNPQDIILLTDGGIKEIKRSLSLLQETKAKIYYHENVALTKELIENKIFNLTPC